MSVTVPRGPQPADDDGLRMVYEALTRYTADHPGATADVYRHGRFLIRYRVVDARFENRPYDERLKAVWSYLETMPEEVVDELYTQTLLAPDEMAKSIANMDFDNPVPARL